VHPVAPRATPLTALATRGHAHFAEFGVMLLLSLVGLELKP